MIRPGLFSNYINQKKFECDPIWRFFARSLTNTNKTSHRQDSVISMTSDLLGHWNSGEFVSQTLGLSLGLHAILQLIAGQHHLSVHMTLCRVFFLMIF